MTERQTPDGAAAEEKSEAAEPTAGAGAKPPGRKPSTPRRRKSAAEASTPPEPLEPRAERAAAAAARSVSGVGSLRPGLFATVIRMAQGALSHPGSGSREAGVSAQLRGDELHVHVQLATRGNARVLDVVREVRTEVAARVEAETGHAPIVHVIVTDVARAG